MESQNGSFYFLIDNLNSKKQENELILWLSIPQSYQNQNITHLSIHPEPNEIMTDESQLNKVGIWKFKDIKVSQILIEFKFHLDYSMNPILEMTDDLNPFLRSEDWIEITEDIIEISKEITEECNSRKDKAEALFRWVVDNVRYEYPDMKNRGVKKSFSERRGDCGEFTVIYCALCRAIGIPARPITCLWFSGSGHQWAEIYFENEGWIPVDPSLAQEIKNPGKVLKDETKRNGFLIEAGVNDKPYTYLFGKKADGNISVYRGINNRYISSLYKKEKCFKFLQPGGRFAYPDAFEYKGFDDQIVQGFIFDFKNLQHDEIIRKIRMNYTSYYLEAGLIELGIEGINARLELNPEDGEALFYLGSIYFEKGQFKDAEKYLEKSLNGSGGSSKPVLDAWALIQLGNIQDQRNERDQAIDLYHKVLETNIDYDGSLEMARKYLQKPFCI